MTDPQLNTMQSRLADAREKYRSELPQRLAAIDACWRAILEASDANLQFHGLLRHVHSLAGSAGTFGFDTLGCAARALEQLLDGVAVEDLASVPEKREQIGANLAALRERALDEPSRLPDAYAISAAPVVHGDASSLLYVIEDDPAQAEEMSAQMGTFGWRVKTLDSATAARQQFQREIPAAVVVDMVLPEGAYAGTELMRGVQGVGDARIPHLVVSSRWDWSARLAAVRSGADGFFSKPVDFAALADRLDTLTHRRQAPAYRILIVDDAAALAEHYAQVLRTVGMEVRTLQRPDRLLDELADFKPELVVMDLHMPGCTGVEAARVIRQDEKFTDMPIVFLSTEVGRQQQLAAMQIGADDFLQKPITDLELLMAISVRTERFRAVASLIRQDSLTGLLNHVAIKQRLDGEIARARRSGAPLALALLDIDNFKLVNDAFGHVSGDRVIRGLAQILRRRLRKSDIVGRYGGEEFAVVLPETTAENAAKVIDDLRTQFRLVRFMGVEQQIFCSFSAGVVSGDRCGDSESLLRGADEALYEAKRSGRDRVCIHAPRDAGGRE